MKCPGCQRELNEGASVCRACGFVVDEALLDRPSAGPRSGFTAMHPAPGESLGEFDDVPPTDVSAQALPADDLEHDEKTVSAPPPSMSRGPTAAPAIDADDLEDLLAARTLRAPMHIPDEPSMQDTHKHPVAGVDESADTLVRAAAKPVASLPEDTQVVAVDDEKTIVSPPRSSLAPRK